MKNTFPRPHRVQATALDMPLNYALTHRAYGLPQWEPRQTGPRPALSLDEFEAALEAYLLLAEQFARMPDDDSPEYHAFQNKLAAARADVFQIVAGF